MSNAIWEENVPLAPFTTLAVGGPARWFTRCQDESQVRAALARCHDEGLDLLVLGGGSNLLVADRGFDGLVLRLADDTWQADVGPESVRVRVGAGHDWDRLVNRFVLEDWAGVECLSGIPGSVGAAPLQNIGAYGQELSEVLVTVRGLRRSNGEAVEYDREACGFGYRTSVFKRGDVEPLVITSTTLNLTRGGAPRLRYPDLDAEVMARGGSTPPSLPLVREAVLAVRRRKSMVLDASDPNSRSAGSFFLNPVVDVETAERLREQVAAAGYDDSMPAFDAGDGRVKLSAAWLLERAGFTKGYGHGPVGLSAHHVLALINRGGAQAADLMTLAIELRRGVENQLGIRLVPEPNLVGFDAEETTALAP